MFWVVSVVFLLSSVIPRATENLYTDPGEVEYQWELLTKGTSKYYIHLKRLKVRALNNDFLTLRKFPLTTTCTTSWTPELKRLSLVEFHMLSLQKKVLGKRKPKWDQIFRACWRHCAHLVCTSGKGGGRMSFVMVTTFGSIIKTLTAR